MLREILPNESATATLLRWFSHFFAGFRERSPLAPGQASKAAARNFFQNRIDFLGDEFVQRHLPSPFSLDPSPPEHALHKGRPAEAEEMRVKPPDGTAAEKRAMADYTLAIEADQQEADRKKGGAKLLRL